MNNRKIEYDDVRLVSGAYFQTLDEPIEALNKTEKLVRCKMKLNS